MRYGILGVLVSGRSFVEDRFEGMAVACCAAWRSGLMPNEDDDVFMMARVGFTVARDDFG